MRFFSSIAYALMKRNIDYPVLVLEADNWDDYGYVTTFKLYFFSTYSDKEVIGNVKVLDNTSRTTRIDNSFNKLPDNLCSLGQTMDYYIKLKEKFPDTYIEILDNLNDVAFNLGIRDKFESYDGFKTSLLRFSEAEKALKEARSLLLNGNYIENSIFKFNYSIKLEPANAAHSANFDFSEEAIGLFRTHVIVGKNGTGKTQFITKLAASLCDINSPGIFQPTRPLFSRIIAISFSIFDEFYLPENTREFSYKYIGYRTIDRTIDEARINNRLKDAFDEISNSNRETEWFDIINDIIPLDIFGLDTDDNFLDSKRFTSIIARRNELLSSGQSMIIFILSELIANLRRDSIILFDEPETHLHPNAIAKLIKSLNKILSKYNSYAIIATHSPIIVQETPSRHVKLFDRIGNTPIVKDLPEESFGENLSTITDVIFYRNQVKEVYKETFDELIEEYSIEEINKMFNNRLSFSALVYLNAAINNKKK
jgi:predicted ATPase